MANPTLLDIAKANGSDAVVGLIDEAITTHPELTMGAARTIKGINYKTLVRTANPTVAFRNVNEGSVPVIGTYTNRQVECFILNPRWECDKAAADRYEDGAAAYISLEASSVTEAAMLHVSKQFYYGTGNDAKGFPGLLAAYDSTNMVVDATGTTASTGSSVWAVKWGVKDVQFVYGNGGSLDMSEVSTARVTDGSGNPYTAYIQEILGYVGLQVANIKNIGRIKKITEDTGKKLTDVLIATLLSKFPAGVNPDVLLMTKRSQEQLRASRTATNATGAPAPLPSEAFGIPIAVTEALVNTEELTL